MPVPFLAGQPREPGWDRDEAVWFGPGNGDSQEFALAI